MEDMLGRFKGDLGAIGADIRQLQEQSAAMSVRLKNRQAAEQRLASFLDSLALPPALITTIVRVRTSTCMSAEPKALQLQRSISICAHVRCRATASASPRQNKGTAVQSLVAPQDHPPQSVVA